MTEINEFIAALREAANRDDAPYLLAPVPGLLALAERGIPMRVWPRLEAPEALLGRYDSSEEAIGIVCARINQLLGGVPEEKVD